MNTYKISSGSKLFHISTESIKAFVFSAVAVDTPIRKPMVNIITVYGILLKTDGVIDNACINVIMEPNTNAVNKKHKANTYGECSPILSEMILNWFATQNNVVLFLDLLE